MSGGVPLSLTHFELKPSQSGGAPFTLALKNRAGDRDHSEEGIELDLTEQSLRGIIKCAERALELHAAGRWPVRS